VLKNKYLTRRILWYITMTFMHTHTCTPVIHAYTYTCTITWFCKIERSETSRYFFVVSLVDLLIRSCILLLLYLLLYWLVSWLIIIVILIVYKHHKYWYNCLQIAESIDELIEIHWNHKSKLSLEYLKI